MAQKVGVVGLGNWGTALAHLLASNGHSVLGWTIDKEIELSINASNRNPCFQSDVALSANLRATGDLSNLTECETIVLALPSQALSSVVPQLNIKPRTIVVSAIKGLEGKTLLTPLQYVEDTLQAHALSLVVISGPTFAADVIRGRPAGLVAACRSLDVAESVAQLFSSDALKVYMSTDPLGVELGGILKNVIAIAIGVCDGLELGDSARAGLITRGLAEMMRLAEAMGANPRTLAGLSGLGDLVMTSTCDQSRNRTVGLRLGSGQKLPEILSSLGSVAEGVVTTPLVLSLADKFQVEMPIMRGVSALLERRSTPQQLAKELISRPLKREF